MCRRRRSRTRRAAAPRVLDEDLDDLARLVGVLGREDERQAAAPVITARGAGASATISCCAATISSMPLSARPSSASSSARVNATPSAVPCTSTKRPSPVITTFMSTSARTSSVYSRSSIGVPSMTPTEIAAHGCRIGCRPSVPFATSRLHASCSAIQPPQIDAVRVPPSACSTSQSTVICTSGISRRSVTARSDRPMRRWISCVRPLCLPLRRLARRRARATSPAASSTRR